MLHYKKTGKGNPVFLIHGFPNDGSTWDSILPLLSTNYTYIIIDLPGAGKSAAIKNLSLELMAKELKKIMEHENIESAIFVGHSMGGYTIMEATQHFPEHIKAISLVHSLASFDTEEKKEARKKSIKLLLNGDTGKTVFLKAMADNLFAQQFKAEHSEFIDTIVQNGLQLSANVLSEFYTSIMNRTDKTEWLKQNTSIPIQWIIGEEDNATTMREALHQCYLSSINDVQLYRAVGHMSMMECPERLANDLNLFFDFAWNNNL